MHRTTAGILQALEQGPGLSYLRAERLLLEEEHSLLSELRLEERQAPKSLQIKAAKRLVEIEGLLKAKEAELQAERCRMLGIYVDDPTAR